MRVRFPVLAFSALSLCVAAAIAAGSSARNADTFEFHYDNVLGTSYDMAVLARDQGSADRANAAALSSIANDARVLSAWDRSSEFSRWAAGPNRPVRVSAELYEVLGLFDTWRAKTNGALDASAETALRLWNRAAAAGRKPEPAELGQAIATMRQQHWSLGPDQTAYHLDKAPLVLSSFAKSYILERANRAAMNTGIFGSMVNVGGDLSVRGSLTRTVEIADPRADALNQQPLARLSVRDLAVATSGSYRRGVNIAGTHFSHIVDPRTALPADEILSATVVAPGAVDAGALATAFSVMKPEESRRLAATIPGIEFLLVDKNGLRVASSGWNRLVLPMQARAAAVTDSSTWDPSMELLVDLDIAQPAGFAKRPYLAVWVEDAAKFPVRTVALWYNRDRWLPELRAWYNSDRSRASAEGKQIASTVSSATRPAGKYSIVWDGKDNSGKLVKKGKYTLLIEASREHGPYQLMRAEIDVNGTPRQIALTGNTDIATATLDYRHTLKQ